MLIIARDIELSDGDENIDTRKKNKQNELDRRYPNPPSPNSSDGSEKLDDSDYDIEYERDIVLDKLMKIVNKVKVGERKSVQKAFELITTIKYDRRKIVTIDGQEYHCKFT